MYKLTATPSVKAQAAGMPAYSNNINTKAEALLMLVNMVEICVVIAATAGMLAVPKPRTSALDTTVVVDLVLFEPDGESNEVVMTFTATPLN